MKLLAEPFLLIVRHGALIRSMVRRDIAARYRGSFGDALWTVLNPLLLMAAYYFVFGVVLRARFRGDPSPAGYALYFLSGMLPWLAISEAVGRAPYTLLEYRNFIKKIRFPVETLPVNLVFTALATQAFALLVFLAFLVWARGGVPVSALWLPVLALPQVLLTLGLAWMLAALGLFVRDLGQVMGFLLTLWFFLTPICYPQESLESLPPAAQALLAKNPVFQLVRAWRLVLLEGHAPPWGAYFKLTAAALVLCLAGYALYRRLRPAFADVA